MAGADAKGRRGLGKDEGAPIFSASKGENEDALRCRNTAQTRTVMKRCCYSESGQQAYLAYLFFGFALSIIVLGADFTRSAVAGTGPGRQHIKVIDVQPLLWLQVAEAYLDVSLVIEVVALIYVAGAGWHLNWLHWVDIAVVVWCIATFVIYVTYPSTPDFDQTRDSTMVFVSRQGFRLVRVAYFFIWFSRSVVEFREDQQNGRSSPGGSDSEWKKLPTEGDNNMEEGEPQDVATPSTPGVVEVAFEGKQGPDEDSTDDGMFQFDSSDLGGTVDNILAATRGSAQ